MMSDLPQGITLFKQIHTKISALEYLACVELLQSITSKPHQIPRYSNLIQMLGTRKLFHIN